MPTLDQTDYERIEQAFLRALRSSLPNTNSSFASEETLSRLVTLLNNRQRLNNSTPSAAERRRDDDNHRIARSLFNTSQTMVGFSRLLEEQLHQNRTTVQEMGRFRRVFTDISGRVGQYLTLTREIFKGTTLQEKFGPFGWGRGIYRTADGGMHEETNYGRIARASSEFSQGFRNIISKISSPVTGPAMTGIRNIKESAYNGTFGELTNFSSIIENYRGLLEAGQSFQGSIMGMARAAALAGMPLEMFTKAVTESSTAIKLLGGPIVWASMQKSIRNTVGTFGLSIQEFTDEFGQFLQGELTSGSLLSTSTEGLKNRFVSLMTETSDLTEATGKARREIMAQVLAIKESAEYFGLIRSIMSNMREDVTQSLDSMAAYFAALPGKIGNNILNDMRKTLVTGTLLFTQSGRALQAFAPALRESMDEMSRAVRFGDKDRAERMRRVTEKEALDIANDQRRMAHIVFMAEHGVEGASQALETIQAFANAAKSRERMEAQRTGQQLRNLNAGTTMITELAQRFYDVLGQIRAGFLEGLGAFEEDISRWFNSNSFSGIVTSLVDFSKSLGTMFGNFIKELTPEKVNGWIRSINNVVSGIIGIGKFIVKVFDNLGVATTGAILAIGAIAGPFISMVVALRVATTGLYGLARAAGAASLGLGGGGIGGTGRTGRRGRGILGKIGSIFAGGGILRFIRAGTLTGIIAAAAGMIIEPLMDYFNIGGKKTVSNMLTYGGIGALGGSLFGPLGTLVGGLLGSAVGAIIENWDDIWSGLGNIWRSITDTLGTFINNIWTKITANLEKIIISYLMTTPLGVLVSGYQFGKNLLSGNNSASVPVPSLETSTGFDFSAIPITPTTTPSITADINKSTESIRHNEMMELLAVIAGRMKDTSDGTDRTASNITDLIRTIKAR